MSFQGLCIGTHGGLLISVNHGTMVSSYKTIKIPVKSKEINPLPL
jgi:hypothetical protein